MEHSSNWGGARPGAGQKPKWNTGETKPVRIPAALTQEVLWFARCLDADPTPEHQQNLLNCQLDSVTESNCKARLHELITRWEEAIEAGRGPRWYMAKKLLAELKTLDSETEST
jgi:hypothetical protein